MQIDVTRMMSMSLGQRLLGIEITADIYVRNGFRLISVPACAEPQLLESRGQQFRNMYKLDADDALHQAFPTGYDDYVAFDDALGQVSRLNDPRNRLVCELFWPHLSGKPFEQIRASGAISSAEVQKLLTAVLDSDAGSDSGIAQHALAVASHNRAITGELSFASAEAEWDGASWQQALLSWANLFQNDGFWKYIAGRIESFDHPHLKPRDIDQLRAKLPLVILGFNSLFARIYASSGHTEAGARHIALIRQSGFSEAAKEQVLGSLVQTLAVVRLDPLIDQFESALAGQQERISRQEFEKLCEPVMTGALRMRDDLIDELGFSEELVERAEFDRLGELVHDGLQRKIDYRSDDRVRSILYSSLVTRKLLQFPLSGPLRSKLEQELLNDREILYGEFVTISSKRDDSSTDPTRCWFVPGVKADPDASIVLPVYKITEVSGTTVSFQTRYIVVPRSLGASMFHNKRITLEELAAMRDDQESKQLLSQIKEIEAACEESVKKTESECERLVSQELQDFEAKLKKFDAEVATEKKEHRAYRKKIESELQRDIEKEEKRCKKACRTVKERYASPISEAQKKHRQIIERNKGWQGALHIELPAMAIAALLIAAVLYVWGAFTLGEIGAIGALSGILSGMLIGRGIRNFRILKAVMPLKALQRKQESELAAERKESEAKIAQLRKAAEQSSAKSVKRLKTIAEARQKILDKKEETLTGLREQAETQIAQLRREMKAKKEKLQKKLQTGLKPKPESEKRSFPAYREAKSQGYRDGKGPSQDEVNRLTNQEFERFMNSLSYEERNLLARLSQVLSNENMNKLLNSLMSVSASERRIRLLEFIRHLGGY